MKKTNAATRWLCLLAVLLLLAGCGRQAVEPVLREQTKHTTEEETEASQQPATKLSAREREQLLAEWAKPDPYTAAENSGRKNTRQALHAELEQNLKDRDFPPFAGEMMGQMIDRLYTSYDQWNGFFPDMPDKHAFIRVHLIDILPKIKTFDVLEEGTEAFDEAVSLNGSFASACSDGESIHLMGDRDWTPEEDGRYSVYALNTVLHEIQHVAQNDIMYSEYFALHSPQRRLRYMFVEGGASFYAAFLDVPGTSDSGYSCYDNDRWLEYRSCSEESESYDYWTKYVEKIVWMLGFKTVGKVFAAQPYIGFEQELADRYGETLSGQLVQALGDVAENYYPYGDRCNEDDEIIDQIIRLERVFTAMLECRIDALENRQDVWAFIDAYRHYRSWFIPELEFTDGFGSADYIDGFIGLNRAAKRLTAKIEEYGVLRFSDDPALNSEAIQTLLYRKQSETNVKTEYAFFQTDSYGKLYFKTVRSVDDRTVEEYEAYRFDATGDRRYYSDSYLKSRSSRLNHKECEQNYYPLSHFSPNQGRGKVFTKWEDEPNRQISQAAPTRRQITFGSYPQTQVKDSALIRKLNALPTEWTVQYLIVGEDADKTKDVKVRISDVTLDGKRYRAAQLAYDKETYANRVPDTDYPYTSGKIYWFAYEPLTWSVIDEENGTVFCDRVVDFEPFHTADFKDWDDMAYARHYTDETKQHYRNQYAFSSVREWLNGAFLNAAFGEADQKKLRTATISNEPYSSCFAEFGTQPVKDRVFLPSVSELTDAANGFSAWQETKDAGRAAVYTDYARLLTFDDHCAGYVLRTAGNPENEFITADESGHVLPAYHRDGFGVRPAACVDLTQFT